VIRSTKTARKRIGAGLALIGITTLVAACGGGGSSSDGGGASSSGDVGKPSTGNVTLTWWDFFGYSPEADTAMKDLVAAYEKAHPNVTIKRTAIGFADYRTKLIQAAATGKFPDFAFINASEVPAQVEQGGIADLSKYAANWADKDQFYPNMLKQVLVDGKFYGAPYRTATTALFYNEDLMKKAGITKPPSTFDELRADAKKLTTGNTNGFCFAGTQTEESTFSLAPFFYSAGSDFSSLGDAGSVKALSLLNDMINVDKSVPKSVLGWGQLEVADQMASGNCAMMVNGPWGVTPLDGKVKFKWGIAKWPAGDAGSVAQVDGAAGVAGNGKHVADAFEIIKFVSDPKNITQQAIDAVQLLPNRKDEASDARFTGKPGLKNLAAQLPTAHAFAYGPKYVEISPIVQQMLQDALSGQQTPDAAAKAAGEKIKPLLPSGS
jgi:multiple sugar transport system substrate-binding protein